MLLASVTKWRNVTWGQLSQLFSTDLPPYLCNLKPCGCTRHKTTDAEPLISSICSQPSGKHEKIPTAESKVTIGRKLQKYILATGHFKSNLFIFPLAEWPGFILQSPFSSIPARAVNCGSTEQSTGTSHTFFMKLCSQQRGKTATCSCQYLDKGFRVITPWRPTVELSSVFFRLQAA